MNEYPPPYNQTPQAPQQPFPSQPGVSQPGQYPNYPPQSGQYPNYPPQSGQYTNYPPQPGQYPNYPPQSGQYTNYPPQSGQYTNYPPQSGQYTNYPPQPGQYPNYQMPPNPQFQIPIPGAGQPKKKRGPWFWILIAIGTFIVLSMCIGISQAANQSGSASNTSPSTADNQAPTATPTPTATPVPTLSPAQVETAYKATTSSTTVENLDKDGSSDNGKDVYFTCRILKFVKNDSGNTTGANVDNPYTYSASVIQIIFPAGTDISQLNEGDILEVWGTDQGVFSGQNAFGGTVQEVEIMAQYINDQTTKYQTS